MLYFIYKNPFPHFYLHIPHLKKRDNNNKMLSEEKKSVAPRAGFEPATNRLTAGCSTTELPGNSAQLCNWKGYSKAILICKG